MVRLYTEDLHVSYDDHLIVKGLSIQIPDQKVTAVIGANGCGKSTFLKAVTRLIPHQSGEVVLDGGSIAKQKTKQLAQKMAILPQTQEAASGLTVGELVSYGRFPYQNALGRLTPRDMEVIDWALDVTNTSDFKLRQVDALSGGQRQRVWIAMALAQETDIIFLDEPTTGLDPQARRHLWDLIEKVRSKGISVIMTTHYMDEAEVLCDRIAVMDNGKIVAIDTPRNLIDQLLKRGFKKKQEVQQASLEDVFIDLTGKGLRDGS